LTSKKPGDQLDAGVFGIESLARFGPTGYIYEVGAEVGHPRTFWAGPMLNRMAAAIRLVRPDRLPGATTNAVVQIESAYGEHRYILVNPDTVTPITLAEWNLISIPLMFAQAVTVTPAAEVAVLEEWPTGSIGPVVESKVDHVTGVVTS
jgi:hypothetical protein